MKKALAIVLSIAMLFCVLTINVVAEDATPTVTIVTNEGSPVAQGITTYFTVRFDDFSAIKGVDVTITADQYIDLGTVTATGFANAAGLDVNYTEENEGDEHTIRFVDLVGEENCMITFEATVPEDKNPTADPTITVTGKFADSGKTFFDVKIPATGTFELTKAIETTKVETAGTVTAPANKFIPAGGVYTGEGANAEFVDKNEDGSFDAPANAVYQTYDIPENGITTFGASDGLTTDASLKFGSYSELLAEGTKHGTMVFEGEWLALKNYYIKKGYTVQQFVEAIYKDVTAKLAANPTANYVYYKVDGKQINVYRFEQKNYMWKSEDNTILEYAIRLHGIQAGTTYTGVAFSVDGNGAVTISENVKSVSK